MGPCLGGKGKIGKRTWRGGLVLKLDMAKRPQFQMEKEGLVIAGKDVRFTSGPGMKMAFLNRRVVGLPRVAPKLKLCAFRGWRD